MSKVEKNVAIGANKKLKLDRQMIKITIISASSDQYISRDSRNRSNKAIPPHEMITNFSISDYTTFVMSIKPSPAALFILTSDAIISHLENREPRRYGI